MRVEQPKTTRELSGHRENPHREHGENPYDSGSEHEIKFVGCINCF
jgi:hypothetical protein